MTTFNKSDQTGRETKPQQTLRSRPEQSSLSLRKISRDISTKPQVVLEKILTTLVASIAVSYNAITNKGELVMSTARVVQAAIVEKSLVGPLIDEIRYLCDKGDLDPGYFGTPEGMESVEELLRAVESGTSEPKRLECIRKIFLAGALEPDSQRSFLSNKMLRIACALTVDEILLFSVFYPEETSVVQTVSGAWQYSRGSFLSLLAVSSGLQFPEYALEAVKGLSEKRLVGTFSMDNQRITFEEGVHTDIGRSFAQFLEMHDEHVTQPSSAPSAFESIDSSPE